MVRATRIRLKRCWLYAALAATSLLFVYGIAVGREPTVSIYMWSTREAVPVRRHLDPFKGDELFGSIERNDDPFDPVGMVDRHGKGGPKRLSQPQAEGWEQEAARIEKELSQKDGLPDAANQKSVDLRKPEKVVPSKAAVEEQMVAPPAAPVPVPKSDPKPEPKLPEMASAVVPPALNVQPIDTHLPVPSLMSGLGRPVNPAALVQLSNQMAREQQEKLLRDQKMPKGTDPMGEGLPSAEEAKAFVRGMMKHAWNGYRTKAWGQNEVRPVSGGVDNTLYNGISMGATVVDSLDTLVILELDEEYKQARDWIAESMRFDHDIHVSAFETTIRMLGGLLAAYGLTHDPMYVIKAKDIGDRLFRTFDNRMVPLNWVNLKTGQMQYGPTYTAEMGTLQMEYEYLSDVTGDNKYRNSVLKLRNLMWEKMDKNTFIVPIVFDGTHFEGKSSLGAMGDSYFEYLLKTWIQGGKVDPLQWEMYEKVSNGLVKHMWVDNERQGGYSYFDTTDKQMTMDHLACFAAGMFSLGAQYHPNPEIRKRDMRIAAEVTETCHASYDATPSKLGPEVIRFNQDGSILQGNQREYILRPETVEAYFYLWRFTRDPKYRQWGWEAAQAIERNCRSEFGYAAIEDVYAPVAQKRDMGMPSFFLAETLKYLYLLFSDDDAMPLEDYVFNTEAHPFPVMQKRKNTYKNKVYVK